MSRTGAGTYRDLAKCREMGKQLEGVLEYYEDPTPTLEGMAELRRVTGPPLATNMVVVTMAQFAKNGRTCA